MASSRPGRRAAAARAKIVMDDSDEENMPMADDDAFEEPDQTQKRRTTRRKTADATSPTRKTRASMAATATKPLQEGQANAGGGTSRKSSPKKRQSRMPMEDLSQQARALRLEPTKTQTSDVQPEERPSVVAPVKAYDTVLERPMDIVIRSRALPAVPVEVNQTPKARMVIRNLFLTNFKSYAGRQEVGPFHASFSSVVGPNGSGKSNVIDSLLFVFGFRASKMRQGKISALIHNSAAFPDLDHCEVEVQFEEVMDKVCIFRFSILSELYLVPCAIYVV